MKALKNIFVSFFAVFYLFVSIGLTLVSRNCACVNKSCSTAIFESDTDSNETKKASCCHAEEANISANISITNMVCHCHEPLLTFIKLGDYFDDHTSVVMDQNTFVYISYFEVKDELLTSISGEKRLENPHYSPPENHYSGRFLVNFLNQRKIAIAA